MYVACFIDTAVCLDPILNLLVKTGGNVQWIKLVLRLINESALNNQEEKFTIQQIPIPTFL